MKLHILGTGMATVLDNYNNCFVIENDNKFMLVDSGGGNRVIKQLNFAKIDLNNIEYGFITHLHGDHILGYAWIMRMIALQLKRGNREKSFTLFGSKECLEFIKIMSESTIGRPFKEAYGKNLIFQEVEDGSEIEVMGLKFKIFDIYAFDTPQLAFFIPEKQFAFCGDMPLNEKNFDKFKGYDYLCLEAFCLESERKERELPLRKHKTVKEASVTAEKLKVKNLILWHTDDNLGDKRVSEYTREAKENFSGNVILPEDLEQVDILNQI